MGKLSGSSSAGRWTLQEVTIVQETIETYRESVVQLADFLAEERLPDEVRELRREHIEAWMIELLGRRKPATVNNRYRGLQVN